MKNTISTAEATRETSTSGTYDVTDMAELLKCSQRHVHRLNDQRKIPGVIRLGRLVRFSKAAVDSWLANGK